MQTQERNKRTMTALFNEAMNGGDLSAADKYITPDRPDHDPAFPPEMLQGREGFKRAIGWIRSMFPDLKFTPEFMVAEGDYVVTYGQIEGTNQGDIMGAPATGKKIKLANIDICRFTEDGQIAEHWGTFNMMEMMKQLGMMSQRG